MHTLRDSDCQLKESKCFGIKSVWKFNMHLVMRYLEQSFQIMIVVAAAEVLRRIFRILYEYVKYSNYYEHDHKLMTITKRSIGMNLPSSVGFIFLFIFFICIMNRGIWPSAYGFAYMPLYWAFMALGMGNSHLSLYADLIREKHGLDYAAGMASNYFHGYLKLILPIQTDGNGLKERMELYENKHQVKFAIKRLFILIPNGMFINPKIESKILKKDGVKPLETFVKNRAGVERPYKNDVYRFNIPINGTYYYVATEGATPLVSFFESLSFEPSTTWQMKEMSREILLKFYKHLKYLLNKWPETQEKAELVLYNSYKPDGRSQDVGEVLLSHITNMWQEGEG